jgi:hypothetical protein
VGQLNRPWDDRKVMGAEIFALEREIFGFPSRQNEIERLFEAFAALLLRDI